MGLNIYLKMIKHILINLAVGLCYRMILGLHVVRSCWNVTLVCVCVGTLKVSTLTWEANWWCQRTAASTIGPLSPLMSKVSTWEIRWCWDRGRSDPLWIYNPCSKAPFLLDTIPLSLRMALPLGDFLISVKTTFSTKAFVWSTLWLSVKLHWHHRLITCTRLRTSCCVVFIVYSHDCIITYNKLQITWSGI